MPQIPNLVQIHPPGRDTFTCAMDEVRLNRISALETKWVPGPPKAALMDSELEGIRSNC
jgi:hypothetical protein